MTSYSGRRAPNVSQYIANLNIPQENSPTEDLLATDDLNLFATTDFFDFDMGDNLSNLPPASEYERSHNARKAGWQEPSSKADFLNNDFQFPDLANFPSISAGTNFQADYPLQHELKSPNAASPTSATPRGEKRKLNSISGASSEVGLDGEARVAAEEDKRRRNTAASARFRIKKKQREQALEKTAKDMTEKASKLETKVQQLEMENTWLKGLITEKNDVKGDFQELYEKFTKERSEDERSRAERTDGVGTTAADDDFDAEGSDE